jgi:hypothetical protein
MASSSCEKRQHRDPWNSSHLEDHCHLVGAVLMALLSGNTVSLASSKKNHLHATNRSVSTKVVVQGGLQVISSDVEWGSTVRRPSDISLT